MKFVVPLDYVETPGKHTSGGFYEKEGKYHLPKAICERALGRRDDIAALRVSTTCKSKTAATPTCGLWSAVNTKQQAAPPAGKYFTADAGVDAGDAAVATGWGARPVRATGLLDITGIAVGRSRVWVVGAESKAAGFGLPELVNTVELRREADGTTNDFPPSIVVGNEHAAALFPFSSGDVAIRRYALQSEQFETKTSANHVAAAAPRDDSESIVLAFLSGTTYFVLKVYSPSALNGDQYVLDGVTSEPVGLSFPPGSRTAYLTAGVALYRVADIPIFQGGGARSPNQVATHVSFAPMAYASGGGRVLGVFATTDTVYWGMTLPGDGGAPVYGILRSSLSAADQSTEWISGISAKAFEPHGVPPIVVGDGVLYFTDGVSVYARRTSETGPVAVGALAPIYRTSTADRGIRALAYASGTLYGATGSGQILSGKVVLP